MFGSSSDRKTQLVKNAQRERQLRQELKRKESSIVKIQACVRMFLCKRRFYNGLRNEYDSFFKTEVAGGVRTALSIFKQARNLLLFYRPVTDEERFQLLCRTIMMNLDVGKEPKYWYMSVMLMKEWTALWIKNLKAMLVICATQLKTLKTFIVSGNKAASLYLSMLMVFTDCTNWKILKIKGGENIRPIMQQLCSTVTTELIAKGLLTSLQDFLLNGLNRQDISLNQLSLTAANTLVLRSIGAISNEGGKLLFVSSFLIIPAYMLHLNTLSSEGVKHLKEIRLYEDTLKLLCNKHHMSTVKSTLDANESLCLIGNLLTMCQMNISTFQTTKDSLKWILSELLKHCQTFVGRHSSNSKWHPLLGWHKEKKNSRSINDSNAYVVKQLKRLWKQPLVGTFYENLPSLEESEATMQDTDNKGGKLRRAFLKTFKKMSHDLVDLNEPIVVDICVTCDLYRTLTMTLTQLKLEIVAGISLQEEVLVRLWRFIYSLGPGGGLKSILNYVNGNTQRLPKPLSSLLILFCECTSQLIPILDDSELYELQKPFTCDDLVKLSAFLNSLVFKLIWNATETNSDKSVVGDDMVKKVLLDLLILLYNRDCRRKFTQTNHWLIKDLKMSHFQNELRENKERAVNVLQTIPHVIPHMERVKIFHNLINTDKRSLGIDKEYSRASALVSIKRSRLLEDGYEQLRACSGTQLKGVIRVKFINEQGLDEAGIDQDGVFKEFLEEVIAQAFNPQLNLFKMTVGGDEQRLFPSPTSFIHENHLQLIEFVGKMLGKAVYEGILVDVPFASFFLNGILQRQQSALYSSIDELPSLDPEMYKNLNFLKNYDGDVSDLDLVFAYDEDILGKIVTRDLKPGGRAIPVTNSNKMTYIHLMARYRLHIQLQEQSAAFIRGFRSIISHEWLSIFSGPELQRLISGDTGSLDLTDLKNNTRYYGGYHSGHQAINWLWDILMNDFSIAEKKLFLKFVTSCSNPPLLGFSHLEPQFSIRFVDCSDEEDSGDSVGSVVRGLFSVRKRGSSSTARLPTASTCFNLLKLPCYKKKTILKEKLRYAIKSGAGFELS